VSEIVSFNFPVELSQNEAIKNNNYTDKAKYLQNNKIEELLREINSLRNRVQEQANELKYLKGLISGHNISTETKNVLNNFITYGSDSNTKALGEGERAAVIASYKSAFDRLPVTETELTDVLKIANGRWPSETSSSAERRAKNDFLKIYKRVADMTDPKDNAAVTVMAYGLRQQAVNRNLDSEKNGIKIFTSIYGRAPQTTEDWNIMQAITYSGATRKIDSDGDGLADEAEIKLGTDPYKRDTDGDGHSDGVEVLNGYDPLKKGV